MLYVLRAVLNLAVADGLIARNPRSTIAKELGHTCPYTIAFFKSEHRSSWYKGAKNKNAVLGTDIEITWH
jgi:hypothetical protein